MTRRTNLLIMLVVVLASAGCGGSSDTPTPATPDPSGLTADELKNGLGPVRAVTLGEVDAVLAATGEEVFTLKCSACHKVSERYIGPALADVTVKRTPAYVMNMILNPEEMIQRHPEAKKLFAEYMTPMANQHLTQDEARAVLEFLRTQAPAH